MKTLLKTVLKTLLGLMIVVVCVCLGWNLKRFLRPFPSVVDRAQLEMKLVRGACLGPCPIYSVEVLGDGTVRYCGAGHVRVPGKHNSQISSQAVTNLLEDFRRAHFMAAKPMYRFRGYDLPTYVLALKIGNKETRVVDYGGSEVGMPSEIMALEKQFDEIAGTDQWIKGSADTAEELPSETFNGCPDFSSN